MAVEDRYQVNLFYSAFGNTWQNRFWYEESVVGTAAEQGPHQLAIAFVEDVLPAIAAVLSNHVILDCVKVIKDFGAYEPYHERSNVEQNGDLIEWAIPAPSAAVLRRVAVVAGKPHRSLTKFSGLGLSQTDGNRLTPTFLTGPGLTLKNALDAAIQWTALSGSKVFVPVVKWHTYGGVPPVITGTFYSPIDNIDWQPVLKIQRSRRVNGTFVLTPP